MFYPMMFFAGLWGPQQIMPTMPRDISDYTPLGASVQAIQRSMRGAFPPAPALSGMAGTKTLTTGLKTARRRPLPAPAEEELFAAQMMVAPVEARSESAH